MNNKRNQADFFKGLPATVLMLLALLLVVLMPVSVQADDGTIRNGIDFSPVFDPGYYAASNPDVVAQYGEDPAGLLYHFDVWGMAEGRAGNASFNVFSYRDAYPDLQAAYGSDLRACYMHYLTYGIAEGRTCWGGGNVPSQTGEMEQEQPKPEPEPAVFSTVRDGIDYAPVFDPAYYIEQYADLKAAFGDDYQAAFDHFLNWGMAEGRQGCADFNVFVYRARYADIRGFYGDDLKAIFLHYLQYGISEGRYGSGPMPTPEPIYVLNGIDYSPVYNYDYYISHYPDLKAAFAGDDVAALKHFVNWGMKEKRQGNSAFDVVAYYNAHQDLRLAYGNDWPSYYMHYLRYGRAENRICRNVSTLVDPITVYKGTDVSDIYDFNYYIQHNPDVKKAFGLDENKVLEHFVKYGLKEGRQGKASYAEDRYKELKAQLAPDYPKAKAVLDQVGWNLRSAFDWSVGLTYYGHTWDMPQNGDPGSRWYADYGFETRQGNCYVMAATFYEMARTLGYTCRQIEGGVLDWDGGYNDHSWTEIDLDDETWVFDPNYTNETGNNGWKLKYGQKGTWVYKVYSVMSDEPRK